VKRPAALILGLAVAAVLALTGHLLRRQPLTGFPT
jgi:hypothetical protein